MEICADDERPKDECGDVFSSAPLPRIDDIDIPPLGRWEDERLARSRMPANGDAVGGPRGADPGR